VPVPEAGSPGRFDAVVLAGGAARRLGGVDKPALVVGGTTLLDRALRAVAGAARVVVVGPERHTALAVLWAREEPPGGGPVAALAAALPLLTAPRAVVLAADLPFIDAATVARLLAAAHELPVTDGAVLVDGEGRQQRLVGAYRTAALRRALGAMPVAGASVGAALGSLRLRPVPAGGRGGMAPWYDCDTSEELEAARQLLGGPGEGA
jgi:molybdopterin-guanine dinucleotide biosynthesis protein A